MKKKQPYLKVVSLICLVFIVACLVETPAGEGSAQIANPAAVFCEEQGYAYEIRTNADGSQHEFGYACEMVSPSFLRGGQAFWLGQDVIAPDIFNHLITVNLKQAGSLETPFQE